MKHHETKRLPKLPSKPMKTMLSQIFRPSSRPGESDGRPGPSHRWTPPSDDQDLPRSDMATFTDFETVLQRLLSLGQEKQARRCFRARARSFLSGQGGGRPCVFGRVLANFLGPRTCPISYLDTKQPNGLGSPGLY